MPGRKVLAGGPAGSKFKAQLQTCKSGSSACRHQPDQPPDPRQCFLPALPRRVLRPTWPSRLRQSLGVIELGAHITERYGASHDYAPEGVFGELPSLGSRWQASNAIRWAAMA
jgi:hypothetical protein